MHFPIAFRLKAKMTAIQGRNFITETRTCYIIKVMKGISIFMIKSLTSHYTLIYNFIIKLFIKV